MDFAVKIREIQHSDSSDKLRDAKELFMFAELFLQSAKKAVCDNIELVGNIVPIDMPTGKDFSQAQKFAHSFNLGLVKGESGMVYLSWSTSIFDLESASNAEENKFFNGIIKRLYDAGHQGVLAEEFKKLQSSYPQKDFKLVFGSLM